MARVTVIGAGIIGAACGYFLARDGHDVTVLDRGPAAGGTSSRGEGNILVSDRSPGPELQLALWSAALWRDLGSDLGGDEIELEPKGGLVVATSDEAYGRLLEFAGRQSAAGVECVPAPSTELAKHEPHLAAGLPGGVFYPGDQQVQPARATAALLRGARAFGATVHVDREVTGLVTDRTGALVALSYRGPAGEKALPTDVAINATGTWGGEVSRRLGAPVPVLPRRGFILVTEPLPRVVRHKVFTADYVDNIASSAAGLETSVVVEGTRAGTILIGASRERVGFDPVVSYPIVRTLAAQAVRLFPVLAGICLMRVYRGFRPYCPDHLPVIGADLRVPGVWHACGHEGGGICLAPATGALMADLLAGRATPVDPQPFSPTRFEGGAVDLDASERAASDAVGQASTDVGAEPLEGETV